MNETIPESMNALRLHAPGGVSDLVYERIDMPRPKPGEVAWSLPLRPHE
jgi:NADPH:quinone reductase-like Zn-dependent oxidoreductase